MAFDEEKVGTFVGQVVGDLGATVSSALAHIGDRLGLYRAMAGAGRLTPEELAERTGTEARYVREWLANQAAGGYVEYSPDDRTYELPPEHAAVLVHEDSPVYMAGGWEQMAAIWAVEPKLEAAFQSGAGLGWHEQDARFSGATERFFKPAYRANLVEQWIPALDGVQAKLEDGASVADVGCGHGVTSVLLAQAFPDARVTGIDSHARSVEAARKRAADEGLDEDGRLGFEVATARTYVAPPGGYDLICFFDAVHEFGHPTQAAVHARDALADDGTVMVVEIRAEDRLEDNLTPLGRVGFGMSTFVCTPNALSQDGEYALGGQAGPSAIREVFRQAGFSRLDEVAETEVHQVMEARP